MEIIARYTLPLKETQLPPQLLQTVEALGAVHSSELTSNYTGKQRATQDTRFSFVRRDTTMGTVCQARLLSGHPRV